MYRCEIITFGALKDFFDSSFELKFEADYLVSDVIDLLKKRIPESSKLLDATRAAINEEFVPLSTQINDASIKLFLLPPSSGG